MFLISGLSAIYIILILNLLVIAFLKARTTIIIVITLSNLGIILFYNIIIPDYQILKELIIVTIIYSAIMLTLISNSNHIYIANEHSFKIPKISILAPIVIILTLTIVSGVFYLVKNIDQTSLLVREKKIIGYSEINKNPLIFPGHPVHTSIKKYYFGENINNKFSTNNNNENEQIKELYGRQYKKILRKKLLFKKLNEAIIIIIAAMAILLLKYQYKSDELQ